MPGEQHCDHGDDQDRVAAVAGELLRGDDPQPGHRQNPDGDLKQEPDPDQGEDDEAVVLRGADLDVELIGVEVEQEVERRGHDDEIGEYDPADEQERDREQHRQHDALLARAERGEHEGVDLVEQDRQRQQDPAVERELDRGEEGLGGAERDRLEITGQGLVGDLEQLVVLPEAEHHREHEHRGGDDDAGAQLVEMLDQRHPIVELG